MEMETLSRDIADSNSRLEGAKLVGSDGLAQVIQKEIGQLERRRSDLLANIANVVGGQADAGQQVPPAGNPASEEAAAAIEQETKSAPNTNDIAEDSEALNMESNRILPEHDAGDETAEEIEAAKEPDEAELRAPGVVTPLSSAMTAQSKPIRHERMPAAPAKMSGPGLGSAWNRLTPADVDRAKQDLKNLWVDTLVVSPGVV
jgi:hypothetical protein